MIPQPGSIEQKIPEIITGKSVKNRFLDESAKPKGGTFVLTMDKENDTVPA
jgi:hypothetical protein